MPEFFVVQDLLPSIVERRYSTFLTVKLVKLETMLCWNIGVFHHNMGEQLLLEPKTAVLFLQITYAQRNYVFDVYICLTRIDGVGVMIILIVIFNGDMHILELCCDINVSLFVLRQFLKMFYRGSC